tara:strand:- start:223 stop:357 length:135 start_codon:yes stop_codon:yes gene_type:complete
MNNSGFNGAWFWRNNQKQLFDFTCQNVVAIQWDQLPFDQIDAKT